MGDACRWFYQFVYLMAVEKFVNDSSSEIVGAIMDNVVLKGVESWTLSLPTSMRDMRLCTCVLKAELVQLKWLWKKMKNLQRLLQWWSFNFVAAESKARRQREEIRRTE